MENVFQLSTTSVMGLGCTNDGVGIKYQIICKSLSPGTGRLEIHGNFSSDVLEACQVAINLACNNSYFDLVNTFIILPDGIDGRSCALPIFLALYAKCNNLEFQDNIAVTGDLDFLGNVLPVEDIKIKMEATKKCERVIMPWLNWQEVELSPPPYVHPVTNIKQAVEVAFKPYLPHVNTFPVLG